MPGPSLPALLRISMLLGQMKNRWRPPRGVMLVSVFGSGPYHAVSLASAASPSVPSDGSLSVSSTHMPLPVPVGAPIMALGHFASHHARICVWSVVASLKPCAVIGFLSSVLHGKTGIPWRAYSSAASNTLGGDDGAV